MSGLIRSARLAGKAARGLLSDTMPERYTFLFGDQPPAASAEFATLADQADVIVVVDTCAYAQLDGLEELLRARRDKVLVLDHHVGGDDLGSLVWQDSSAAAAGVLVDEVLEALGWPADVQVAEALAVALTTDTGWLRFSNTDARALRCLARLLEAGLHMDRLYQRLYQNDRVERIKLMTRMLESLRLYCGGRLATMVIRHGDFDAVGARFDETENLVNEPMRLASVEVAILAVENTECVRVSLRSREKVDVAAIARRFGGGGHRRAAGLRLQQDVDELMGQLVRACQAEMGCG